MLVISLFSIYLCLLAICYCVQPFFVWTKKNASKVFSPPGPVVCLCQHCCAVVKSSSFAAILLLFLFLFIFFENGSQCVVQVGLELII